MNRFIILLVIAQTVYACPVFGQSNSITIPYIEHAPALKDFIFATPPASFLEISDFRQRDPEDGTPASRETRAFIASDEKQLFVVFLAHDESDKIRARVAPREQITNDDRVAVYLDTFHDRKQAYVFQVSAAGIQRDGVLTEGQGRDYNFDALWFAESRRTAFGYAVMIRIPFSAIRFPDLTVQNWGIGLSRIIPRLNEQATWPHITRAEDGYVKQFASAVGPQKIAKSSNIRAIPYVSHARARLLDDPNLVSHDMNETSSIGFDAKAVFNDAFALDVTVNPDFSQIGPDAPQVTINQRFEVLFPERRPFFLENAATFETPLPLFFSRRIADPQMGVRFSGKQKMWTIGALVTDDHVPTPNEERYFEAPLESRAWNSVLRVQRNLSSISTVGALMTHRWSEIGSNTVVALDGRRRLNKNWVAEAQAAYGLMQGELENNQQGHALLGTLERSGRYITYEGLFRDLDNQFRANLGSLRRQRLGTRRMQHEIGLRLWPVWGPLLSLGPSFEYRVDTDQKGVLEERKLEGGFEINLKGSTKLSTSYEQIIEQYSGIRFERHQTSVSFRTRALRKLALKSSVFWGTDINRRPLGDQNPFLGNEVGSNVELTFYPTPNLRYELSHRFRQLGNLPSVPNAPQIYNLHLVRAGVHVQLSQPLSFRVLLDAELFRVNPVFYEDTLESRVGADVLITYRANAFSAIYLGFTDRYEYLPGQSASFFDMDRIDAVTWPTTSTARQFFLKVSYLIGR